MGLSEGTLSACKRRGNCEAHGEFEDSGFTLPFGSRTIWTGCPKCSEARVRDEKRQRLVAEERARQEAIERRMAKAGIPLRFRSRSLENFTADSDAKRHALDVAANFVQDFDTHRAKGTTVIFSGKPGTGKSHLAIAIAQALMPVTTVFYIGALDIVRMIRDTWRRDSERVESEVLDDLGSVGLLVIDEIGVHYGTEGEQIILFDVINRRYQDLMPTILLTNLGQVGVKEFLGERSFDRLREEGIWVPFDWNSYRAHTRVTGVA